MNETLEKILAGPQLGDQVGTLPYRDQPRETFAIVDGDRYLRIGEGVFEGRMDRPGPGPVFNREGDLWIESAADILARVDATLLRPEASPATVRAFSEMARDSGCRNVCVFPVRIPDVLSFFSKPATVISFPHGADGLEAKKAEIVAVAEAGAGEIDLVADRSLIAAGDWSGLEDELRALHGVSPVPVKVILETGQMPLVDIGPACLAVEGAGCEYAKTSTGMVPEGASTEAIEAMRLACPQIGIKASGGIRTREAAGAMIRAGADVIGASDPHGLVI